MLPILHEAAQSPGLLKAIYGDLAKPGVKQAGKALSTVLGLGNTILWPVALLNEKAKVALESNLEKYRAQMASVPENNVAAVPPEIGVPVSEKLSYVTDDELSDMFVNLLAKASTLSTASSAHPSFVNIINSLSPDEALLLKKFRGQSELPFITARVVNKNAHEWEIIGDLLTGLERMITLSFPDNLVAYFSNFEGLGLIQVHGDTFVAHPPLYEDLENFYRPSYEACSFDHETHELIFKHGHIKVTPFGSLFMGACLSKLGET